MRGHTGSIQRRWVDGSRLHCECMYRGQGCQHPIPLFLYPAVDVVQSFSVSVPRLVYARQWRRLMGIVKEAVSAMLCARIRAGSEMRSRGAMRQWAPEPTNAQRCIALHVA